MITLSVPSGKVWTAHACTHAKGSITHEDYRMKRDVGSTPYGCYNIITNRKRNAWLASIAASKDRHHPRRLPGEPGITRHHQGVAQSPSRVGMNPKGNYSRGFHRTGHRRVLELHSCLELLYRFTVAAMTEFSMMRLLQSLSNSIFLQAGKSFRSARVRKLSNHTWH